MLAYIVRRLLGAVPVLVILSGFTFALILSVPGDPVDVLFGGSDRDLSPGQVDALRAEMGLDQPAVLQYAAWVSGFWRADKLGRSYRDGRPVLEVIGERCPATLALVGTSLVIAFSAGIAWGFIMVALELRRLPLAAGLSTAWAIFLYSAPGFWLAFLALFLVVDHLPAIPIMGLNDPGEPPSAASLALHLLMPATFLALRRTAKVALFLKAVMLDELRADYVLVARAKGLAFASVLAGHVLRNCLLPLITLAGLSLPALLSGSVLIETVFSWPGMGRLAVDATFARNYPVLLTLVTIYGAAVVLANLVADSMAMLADPRLRSRLFEAGGRTLLPGGAK